MLPVICIHLSWVMVRDWASRLQVLKLSCITVNTSIAKIAKHCSKVLFLSPWMLPRSGMELVWYRRSNMCHRDMQLPIESWSSSEIALNATPHSQVIQTLPTHNTVTERMFNVCRNVCRNASICRSTVEPEGAGAFWCPLEPGGTGAERLKCECELQAQESYVIEKLTSLWSRKVLSGGLLGKPTWFQRSVITRYPDHFGTQKELV